MTINIRNIIFVFLLFLITLAPAFAQKKNKEKKKKKANTELSEKDIVNFENYFVDGNKYFMLENYDKAIDYFRKALNINPNSAVVHFKIADSYLLQNKDIEALPFAIRAVELNDTNKYYYLALADAYQKLNKIDDATRTLQKMLKKAPNSAEHIESLIGIYLYQSKFDDALKAIDKFENVYGFNEEISFQRQQIYLRQNKLNDAFAEAKKLADYFPENLNFEANLAQLYFSNNKVEDAEKTCKSILKKDNNHPQANLIMSDIYKSRKQEDKSREHLKIAFKNPEMNIDGKIAILVSFIRMLPNPEIYESTKELALITTEIHPNDFKSHSLIADLYIIGMERDNALKSYNRALELDNSHFKIWQQVIFINSELNDNKSLIKNTEKALEIFPNQTIFWYFNGMANYLEKNNENAAESLEQGAKLAKDDIGMSIQFYSILGDVYNSLKDFKKSDFAYEYVLKHDSLNDHVLNNYSYFLSLRNEKLELAKYLSSKLVKKYPNSSTYLDTHAWVLYKLKDFEGAKKYLEMAMTDSPSGTVIEHYGDVLFQLGIKDKALEQWKAAKDKGGASDLIDKKIADKKLYE
jgi:tetratricopeptide (TPR) repeat protein